MNDEPKPYADAICLCGKHLPLQFKERRAGPPGLWSDHYSGTCEGCGRVYALGVASSAAIGVLNNLEGMGPSRN